jgi:hypothetical protein
MSFWGGPPQQSGQPLSENRRLCLSAGFDGPVQYPAIPALALMPRRFLTLALLLASSP